jgi:uncharacterized protein
MKKSLEIDWTDPDELSFHTSVIPRDMHQAINLPVGKLPIGHRLYIRVNIFRAPEAGPTVLFMGGLHGDEINGVEVLKRALSSGFFNTLQRGTAIVVSLVNVYGFINFSRDVPDGKDVNRSFPGSSKGSLASRIANVVTKKILPFADFGVDFHTGAANRYNYPQIRYNKMEEMGKLLADTFNAPVQFQQPTIAKSLRRTAQKLKKSIIVFEGGESLRIDEYSIQVAMDGIRNLLIYFGMLPGEKVQRESLEFSRTSWVRASSAGMFTSFLTSGQHIEKGMILGSISDPFGDQYTLISTKKDGFIIGHNNIAVVNQGDALFHIAYKA